MQDDREPPCRRVGQEARHGPPSAVPDGARERRKELLRAALRHLGPRRARCRNDPRPPRKSDAHGNIRPDQRIAAGLASGPGPRMTAPENPARGRGGRGTWRPFSRRGLSIPRDHLWTWSMRHTGRVVRFPSGRSNLRRLASSRGTVGQSHRACRGTDAPRATRSAAPGALIPRRNHIPPRHRPRRRSSLCVACVRRAPYASGSAPPPWRRG